MNQYQKTTEKKKQAIIQAALHLFKEKGFKETSIKSIAGVAEVSPVSIYNYFGSKDNLVALCVNDLFEEITQQAEDILKSNLAFNTKLDQALDLGKEEGLIARDLSTELILNVMDALNNVGNQLAHSYNLETDVKQIHQIFLYGILGKKKS